MLKYVCMKHALNYNWSFIPKFNDEYIKSIPQGVISVDLPHNMVDFPFNYFDEKDFDSVGTYFREIVFSKVLESDKFVLRFGGVNNSFTLYVNSQLVGTFTRPYMEENIDITKYVVEGNNLIVVCVNGSEKVNAPPFGNTVDYFPFSGIYREVTLFVYNALDIIDVKVTANHLGQIEVNPDIRNINKVDYSVNYEVYEGTKLIASSIEHNFTVENPKLWSVNNPNLYNLVTTITANKDVKQYVSVFGFRSAVFLSDGFFLNGEYTPLVGLNRHETYPYVGAAATSFLQFYDVVKLKNLGVNYVRCSHYPPSRAFLDACDFLGLMVINEVPGWQYIGDEAWRKIHLQNIETMINRDFNRPSIIAWSIRINESADHPFYEECHKLAKALDPVRATTGTRNFTNSELFEDIYSYNDFSHDGTNKGLLAKRKVTKSKKPYIVSENNGHMYPTKPFDNPLILESHTKRHLAVLDSFFGDKNIVGVSPWCMHDYYTHHEFGSGDKICYHGVLDIYREPKPAAYVYTSNLTSDPVLFPLFRGDNGDLPESKLYKTMVLSNASYIDLYKDDEVVKRYYPLRDLYKHLPHPPFIIDTFISDNFKSTIKFSKRDRKKIAKLLNYAALNNFSRLSLWQKLQLGWLIVKYRLKWDNLVELWFLNVVGWGDKSSGYTLVGYNDEDIEIIRKRIENTTTTTYEIELLKNELVNTDTFDTTIVTIRSLSPYRNHYDFSPVSVVVTGPLKVYGPEIQNLHAGVLNVYVRSINTTGRGTITIGVGGTIKTFNVEIK